MLLRCARPALRAASSTRAKIARSFAIKVDSDSHSDFAPQSNQKLPESVAERIQQDIEADDVVVYMKGIPSAPQCGFSNAVVQVLSLEGVEGYGSYNVLEDPELRQGIKDFSEWPTVPQVYVKGEFVGGCDIMIQMHKDGELAELLKEAGVETKAK
eukprot:TRINITY_DN979_c0_g1_i1.p1 TRINITY_DN979_c0_g1~~TRINITY_DN979_c0_g1_i1.p1  ORF type:complete len:156 (+),score=43.40 TRINITY_DN979_c0_g1_i1:169-636(+)